MEAAEARRRRFTVLPAVYLILLRGEETLLARRYRTAFGAGQYALVAGHVDGGETATAALVREAREEAGIAVRAEDLRFVHAMHRRTAAGEWFDLFFLATTWQGEPVICEPDRCDDMRWFPLTALPDSTLPYVRLALERWQAGLTFSTYGWAAGE